MIEIARRYREARRYHCSRRDALGVALLGSCPVCADRGLDAEHDVCGLCPAGREREELHQLRNEFEAACEPAVSEMLVEFHTHPNALGSEVNQLPLLRTVLDEEYEELDEAIDLRDRAKIARELADLSYVVYGIAWFHGIDLDRALREIHRAAMDKMRAGLRREDGKILKPPGFVPPDMTLAINGGGA